MNKKTQMALYFGVLGLVTIGLVVTIIRLGVVAQSEIKALKDNENHLEQIIEENKMEYERKIQELEESEAQAQEEKQNILKEYEKLNEKYQEEIKPVSFNSNNLLSPSGANTRKLAIGLKGTGLEGLESSYIEAEKEYGVNAIFLCALTAEESAWGTSNRARNQNNMSGFEVYNDDAVGATFSSKHESIMTTARLLKNHYLTPNGSYFNGYSIYDVNKNYCPVNGTSWSDNISAIANQLVRKINSR